MGLRADNPREGKVTSLQRLACLGFEGRAALSHCWGSSGGQGKERLSRQGSNDWIFLRSTGGFHWACGSASWAGQLPGLGSVVSQVGMVWPGGSRVGPGLRDTEGQHLPASPSRQPPHCAARRNTCHSSVDFAFPSWLQRGLWAVVGPRQGGQTGECGKSLALAKLPRGLWEPFRPSPSVWIIG